MSAYYYVFWGSSLVLLFYAYRILVARPKHQKLLRESTQVSNRTLNELYCLLRVVKQIVGPISPSQLSVISERSMSGTLVFSVKLPAWPDDPDIASGELTYSIDNSPPIVVPVAKGQATVDGLKGDENSQVSLAFVYISVQGVPSKNPSHLAVQLINTLPAPDPSPLTLQVTDKVKFTQPVPPVVPPVPPQPQPGPPVLTATPPVAHPKPPNQK